MTGIAFSSELRHDLTAGAAGPILDTMLARTQI
jgi:hypothetical protein